MSSYCVATGFPFPVSHSVFNGHGQVDLVSKFDNVRFGVVLKAHTSADFPIDKSGGVTRFRIIALLYADNFL